MIRTPWHASRSVHTSSLRSENRTRGKSSGQERWLDSRRATWDFVPVKRERKENGFIRSPVYVPFACQLRRSPASSLYRGMYPRALHRTVTASISGASERIKSQRPTSVESASRNAAGGCLSSEAISCRRAASSSSRGVNGWASSNLSLIVHSPRAALPLSVALPPPLFLQLSFGILRKKAFIGVPIIANCAVDRSGSVTKQFLSYNVTEDLKCCLFDWSSAKFLRVTRPLHMLQDTSAAFDAVTLSIDKY